MTPPPAPVDDVDDAATHATADSGRDATGPGVYDDANDYADDADDDDTEDEAEDYAEGGDELMAGEEDGDAAASDTTGFNEPRFPIYGGRHFCSHYA